MSVNDRDYYERRAEQELLAASMAANSEAARAHQSLADQYALLARQAPRARPDLKLVITPDASPSASA